MIQKRRRVEKKMVSNQVAREFRWIMYNWRGGGGSGTSVAPLPLLNRPRPRHSTIDANSKLPTALLFFPRQWPFSVSRSCLFLDKSNERFFLFFYSIAGTGDLPTDRDFVLRNRYVIQHGRLKRAFAFSYKEAVRNKITAPTIPFIRIRITKTFFIDQYFYRRYKK